MKKITLKAALVAPAASYAALQGEPTFDFLTFLDPARVRTEEEWEEAQNRANYFPTCAVGNQCAALPRSSTGHPLDQPLVRYGMDFWRAIRDREAGEARKVFALIERRAAYLLRQLGVKAVNERLRELGYVAPQPVK